MGSVSKFSFSRLFGRQGSKTQLENGFVPRTAIAARIIGQEASERTLPDDEPAEPLNSFDLGKNAPTGLGLPVSEAADEEDAFSRLDDRFVPTRSSTTITDTRGRSIKARIINLSATGVAIEADFAAVPPESVTHVGQKPVTLGRNIRGGRVFVFAKPLDPARCNPAIVL